MDTAQFRIRLVHALVLVLVLWGALVAGACEGGSPSSSGNQGQVPDDLAPIVQIQFPPQRCLTDAAEIQLALSAFDASGIDFVRVAGSFATHDADGLWRMTVPLVPGENTLTVEVGDEHGNRDADAAQFSIRREDALWVDPTRTAFDSGTGEALVLDSALGALFGVDPVSGARRMRFGPGVGTGAPFPEARDVEFVASRNAALVTDGALDAVLSVDLGNGTRTTLSSPTVGGGPTPLDLQGLVLDAARDRVLVVDAERAELLAVDLASGERTTISSDTLGTGPSLALARGVALDLARNRALVTLELGRMVLAVDLANGNRAVLSGGTTGSGAAFSAPLDIVVDTARDRALVTDRGARALFAVALASGARSVLSSVAFGSPAWLEPVGVTLSFAGAPFLVDSGLDALFEVGAVFGDQRVVTRVTLGGGPSFARPAGLAPGIHLPDQFAVADRDALLVSNVDGGFRRLVSGRGVGTSPPPLSELVDVAVSGQEHGECIIALDAGVPALLRVDRFDGDRVVISGGTVGSGPAFARPRRLGLELPATASGCAPSALVVDRPVGENGRVLRVDLATGARTILSDDAHGTGEFLIDPVAIDVETEEGSAFVLDAGVPVIVRVDLVTGDRQPIFASATPLVQPTDLRFDEGRNRFFVADPGQAALLVADLVGQTLTVVSGPQRGTGPSFTAPVAVELRPSLSIAEVLPTPIAYVLDSLRGCVFAVDTITGERVIQSK